MIAKFSPYGRTKPLLVCVLLFFTALFYVQAHPLTVLSPGDPVLEDIRFLIRESGRSFRSFTPPLSRDEVLLILDDIREEELSDPGRMAYRRIQDALSPSMAFGDGLLGVDYQIRINPEIHLRTNPDIAFAKKDTENPPFVSIPVNAFIGDRVQLTVVPLITSDPTYYAKPDYYFGANVPYQDTQIDMNMPLRAFIATGGPWWNFQIGRDELSYGVGRTGNLAISDNPDYYDFARVSFFSPNFKYSALISQMPLDIVNLLADPAIGQDALRETTQRYMYFHRLDVRLFNKLSLALSEGAMVGNSAPELRFLNPLVLFHSFSAWWDYDFWGSGKGDMEGSIFSFDLDWAVLPSLAIYGQFVMNDFATPWEFDIQPDQPPNGLGYLAGVEYTHAFTAWQIVLYGEFVYTDPYVYTLSTPFSSYIWMRRLSVTEDKERRYLWIGHPEGRDTLLFTLGALFSKSNLAFSFDCSYTNKGMHNIKWDWKKGPDAYNEKTPTGIAEQQFRLSAGTSWKPLNWISLSGYIGGVAAIDANHLSGNNEYGMEAMFSVALVF
jgi:hypothetical protein